jgi:hypothetical protein
MHVRVKLRVGDWLRVYKGMGLGHGLSVSKN